mmetsp:Transcript_49921/g.74470  ORF Transcript_49921/g.74470 Transcript_49921/m.74470 type:complete len:287 (-) Transcript_49921:354-1214(-)|eukprot:CAMPEP_0194030234 /NCGR_PEP_ID=MMETSP0009_2-20130614/3791_1 /TAXON_ID=210454 /ORGANISM="Grammatophora oceanica, Strain CCMP 410" /LENGTH=286 /DNA_ID=CAMNT_0038670141 /DNA_START=94 /DNA_END=954 /DNA_ORIENTATION=+
MDVACLFAALFFLISNILDIVIHAKERNKNHFDFETWKDLDPTYLQEEWAFRRELAPLFHSANVFNAFAWFLLSVPIVQFAWIQSQGGKRKVWTHATLTMLAVGGALTELVSRLLIFGAFSTANWISKSFNLDNWSGDSANDGMGWRALEVTFLVVEGMLTWIDAFEWLALFGVFSLIYYSVGTANDEVRVFSRWWSGLGLLIAFLSFVDFALDVLRWEDWKTFTMIAILVSFANSIVLIPIWLLWFGYSLPKSQPKFNSETDILFQTPIIHASNDPNLQDGNPVL